MTFQGSKTLSPWQATEAFVEFAEGNSSLKDGISAWEAGKSGGYHVWVNY